MRFFKYIFIANCVYSQVLTPTQLAVARNYTFAEYLKEKYRRIDCCSGPSSRCESGLIDMFVDYFKGNLPFIEVITPFLASRIDNNITVIDFNINLLGYSVKTSQVKLTWSDNSKIKPIYNLYTWSQKLSISEWTLQAELFPAASLYDTKYNYYDFSYSNDILNAPAYKIISKFGNQARYSNIVWGYNRTGYFISSGAVWNSPFNVVNYVSDWQKGIQYTVSVEEVAFKGGTVIPFWTQKCTKVDGAKNTEELKHMNLARLISKIANTPLRFMIETRFDVYGEITFNPNNEINTEKAPGFKDEWILTAPKAETCATLLKLNQNLPIYFDSKQDVKFWRRLWPGIEETVNENSENGIDILFNSELCANTEGNLPIFYGEPVPKQNPTKYVLENVLVDVRNNDYIDWHTSWSADLVSFLQPNNDDDIAVFSPLKTGWEAYAFEKSQNLDETWKCPTYYPSLLSDCNDGFPCNVYAPLTACAPYQEDEFESGFRNWISDFHDKSPATSIATNENPSGKNKFSWANDDDHLLSTNNIIGEIYVRNSLEMCDLYPETGCF